MCRSHTTHPPKSRTATLIRITTPFMNKLRIINQPDSKRSFHALFFVSTTTTTPASGKCAYDSMTSANQSLSAKTRKDTGYSTASSQTAAEQKQLRKKAGKRSAGADAVDDGVAHNERKKSHSRKLMTGSQEHEVDGDGLEELERKRCRTRKEAGKGGDR